MSKHLPKPAAAIPFTEIERAAKLIDKTNVRGSEFHLYVVVNDADGSPLDLVVQWNPQVGITVRLP